MNPSPVILFGAFDRHNFGDLLFPHVAAAMLPGRELLFAGLADRDLRPFGGHRVRPLAQVVAGLGGRPADLIHVGGEILVCDAWQAAVMLLSPDEARAAIARFDAQPAERLAWALRQLTDATGGRSRAPYVVPRGRFPAVARIVHAGVGGVAPDDCSPALRAEVLACLAEADAVGVRDRHTLAQLETAGIAARLMPDPAAMVAELFGARIRARGERGEPRQLATAFPQGYLAVQFSADFGDDDTLTRIATQLEQLVTATGLGIALFRAGAAPWHDDLEVLGRTAARIRGAPVRVFGSLDAWDICALIAASRGYCGSSLHGRIVAMAFGLPRVNLGGSGGKQQAYSATWDLPEMPAAVGPDDLAAAMREALASDPARLRAWAARLVAAWQEGFAFASLAVTPAAPGHSG